MGFARTCSVALVGVEGVVVEVQADLEPGLAAFTLVGLPDKSLSESRDRVRAAVVFPVKFSVLLALALSMLLLGVALSVAGSATDCGPGGMGASMRKVCNKVPKGIRLHMSPLGVNFLFPARGGVDMVAA